MQQARCYLLGERAVVLELEPPVSLDNQQRIWGLAQRLQDRPEVTDVVPGMNNITVILNDPPRTVPDPLAWLQQWWESSHALAPVSRDITIPVVYGGAAGPDLAAVADHCGMSAAQVVECHSAVEYLVFFIGFQPGFPYLGGLDPRLHTPRRAEPRLQVPAGAVGIGGAQTGIYPLATPGGWQLIGQAQVSLFVPDRQPPVLLSPGDRVRFVPQKEGVC